MTSLMREARGKAKITILELIGYLFSEWTQFGFTYLENDVNITTH